MPDGILLYWITDSTAKLFTESLLEDYIDVKQGVATSDNNRFLRLWFEVDNNRIGFDLEPEQARESEYKWFPYNKGGTAIRWYGNQDYVVNYYHDGFEMKAFHEILNKDHPGGRLKNPEYYFKEGFTWSTLSNVFAVRYCEKGMIFDTKGSMGFVKTNEDLFYFIGLLNSIVGRYWMSLLAPTLDFNPIALRHVPIIIEHNNELIDKIKACIELSEELWAINECGWSFQRHILIENLTPRIADSVNLAIQKIETTQQKIQDYERDIDAEFIRIYGLNNEIREYDDSNNNLIIKWTVKDLIISLLSYAVGCMFGRFSLDSTGVVFAGGDWDLTKYSSFTPDQDNVIPITDEEYLEDDIVSRLCAWLKTTFGEQNIEENLDYIAKTLGNKGNSSREAIRSYFLNEFFGNHSQMCSTSGSGKRPIYWLFDSGKQNGFKALIYLHRYNADTIGNLRIDYLHRMQRIYESEISRMQDMIDHSTSGREVAQATKRREKLTKQLKECREYDEKLAHLALSRIELDLDDGVKKNYRKIQTANDGKFYEVLADSKNIMSKE